MTTRGVNLAALPAVLVRPAWWLLALAGFLARGGIVLFLLAIVTLPSPLAISNVVAPLLVPIVFGGVTLLLAVVIASGIAVVVLWVLLGAWIGATTEVVLVGEARDEALAEGLPVRARVEPGRWPTSRVAIARLIAHVPLAIAVIVGSFQIINVTYAELTTPSSVATPLLVRIVAGSVLPIVLIAAAWLVGELAGGLAARRIVLDGASVLGAVGDGYGDLVVHPRSAFVPGFLLTVVLAIDLAACLAVVDFAWTVARTRLVETPMQPVQTALALLSFGAAWFLALLVTGIVDAWRSVAMTWEAERSAVASGSPAAAAAVDGPPPTSPDPSGTEGDSGTFGASPERRPGDWSAHDPGGRL